MPLPFTSSHIITLFLHIRHWQWSFRTCSCRCMAKEVRIFLAARASTKQACQTRDKWWLKHWIEQILTKCFDPIGLVVSHSALLSSLKTGTYEESSQKPSWMQQSGLHGLSLSKEKIKGVEDSTVQYFSTTEKTKRTISIHIPASLVRQKNKFDNIEDLMMFPVV